MRLSDKAMPQVLYIDDDALNRTLVNRLLTSYDFRVIEAKSGMEGLQIAQRHPPDLILMDINMPGLDGHETTTRMRSITGLKNIPIIALTANVTQGAKEMALTAGCDGYISKPINVDHFPHQVLAYMEGQKDVISGDDRQHYMGQYSQRLVERLETKILELEEANVRLQKIDKLKSDFITIAAHELRTPITLVYGYARLLQVEIKAVKKPDNEAELGIEDLANKIHLSVHRLSEVVNDILNISLIETNEMQLDTALVHIDAIMQSALDELNPKKNDREIFIELDDLSPLPPIHGDAKRLRQVFWNILSNAIKFTPDHGVITIEGRVAPPPDVTSQTFSPSPRQARRGGLVIAIKDTGIGIDPSEQKEIFDRFYMVSSTAYHSSSKTAFGGGGMGLGLPIARGIVEAHGGRVWVESRGRNLNDHPGSTFYVLLPLDFDPSP